MGLYMQATVLLAAGLCALTQGNPEERVNFKNNFKFKDLLTRNLLKDSLSRIARYDPMHNECGISEADRKPCGKFVDKIAKCECRARACCYDDRDRVPAGTIRCFLPKRMLKEECDVRREEKDDCGYPEISEMECFNRGCCYRPSPQFNDPDCFQPKSVRLMKDGEANAKEGRLELRFKSEWGTVCDDGFGVEEADVVCKGLGYFGGRPKIQAHYGAGTGKIWLDDLDCDGDEEKLEKCDHNGLGEHNCVHAEDAGVECYEEGESTSGDYDWYEYENRANQKPTKPKKFNFHMGTNNFDF